MTKTSGSVSRRAVLGGAIAAGGVSALGMPLIRRASAQEDYPSQTFQVIIPTREGGGAERLARPFDAAWSELLGQRSSMSSSPARQARSVTRCS